MLQARKYRLDENGFVADYNDYEVFEFEIGESFPGTGVKTLMMNGVGRKNLKGKYYIEIFDGAELVYFLKN